MTEPDHPETGRTGTRLITGGCVWATVLALCAWDRTDARVSTTVVLMLILAATWETAVLVGRFRGVSRNGLFAAVGAGSFGALWTALHVAVGHDGGAWLFGILVVFILGGGLLLRRGHALVSSACEPLPGGNLLAIGLATFTGWALLCLLLVRGPLVGGEQGWGWLVWLVAVSKLGDTAAYSVGRSVGGPKLAPTVSPNKTWSGAAASLAAAVAVGLALGRGLGLDVDAGTLLLLAGVVNVASQAGDLVESALKRRANAKDSGSLLPVIGGILDLVDSLLLAAPALAGALWFLGAK